MPSEEVAIVPISDDADRKKKDKNIFRLINKFCKNSSLRFFEISKKLHLSFSKFINSLIVKFKLFIKDFIKTIIALPSILKGYSKNISKKWKEKEPLNIIINFIKDNSLKFKKSWEKNKPIENILII